ncbi:MAG: hypothetical protein HYZ92_06365 [Candidatus Omnitrophica bacterium]|nr:hypothetical protein [Candidatus Omnitrophota bacterium]
MGRMTHRSGWWCRWGVVIVLLVCGLEGLAQAASGDAAGTYTVTVTKVEISKDGGSTYTTLFSGSSDINIASVNAGAAAAGLVGGVILAPGTYDTIRVTIGGSLQLKGYVNNGSTTIYTNGGTDTGAFSTNTAAANTPGSDYATSTFTIPAGSRTSTSSVSIPVSPGASPTVRVTFDTSGVITQSGGIPSVGAPSVTVTAVSG